MFGKVWAAIGMLGDEIQGWAYAARLGRLRTEALLRGEDPSLITLEDAKGVKTTPKALPGASVDEGSEGVTKTPDKVSRKR